MPTTHALLIGIDFYFPNQMPDGSYYPSLGGCVRDVDSVDSFLRKTLKVPDEQITRLSASNNGGKKPAESESQWPTYANIVAAFKKVTDQAAAGDKVYIHYSGHGGRAVTAWPGLKSNNVDEGLVPTDIGAANGQYLRDVEMARLLKAMTDKGLLLTVVLDSCHSGGSTRGSGGAVARRAIPGPGVGEVIDTTVRPVSDLVASAEELAATWNARAQGSTRSANVMSTWLLEPKEYTLLAACRASESAYEYPFESGQPSGALTYWLMDTLKVVSPNLSYSEVRDRVQSKVHAQFPTQTPDLQGIGERLVFGDGVETPAQSVLVLQVQGEKVQVGAGQATGLRKGAQLAVYPPGISDFSQVGERVAILTVTELGAVDSWTTVESRLKLNVAIEQGAPALLLDAANLKVKRTVYLHELPPALHTRLAEAISAGGGGFVRLAEPGKDADYQVAVTADGHFELWDAAGAPIPNLRPALAVADAGSVDRIVQRLVHLSKFASVLILDNRDAQSPLASALGVELLGVQDDFDPVDGPNPKPFAEPNTLNEGQWTFLRIKNKLQAGAVNDPSRILNVCVLNLQPGWAIEQVYPAFAARFEPLDPGQAVDLPLQTSLPEGITEGTDVLKVFATLDSPNFSWLTLPALDKPIQPKGTRSAAMTGLDQLFAAVGEDGASPGTRNANIYTSPSQGWTVGQVEIRTKKV